MKAPSAPLRTKITLACIATLATTSLALLPAAAFADEGPDAEAAAPAAEAATPETEAPAPAPAEPTALADSPAEIPPAVAVVDSAVTTAEEVLADPVTEPTVTLFAADAPALPAPGDPCYPAVCIDNGTVLLAVNPTGELNTTDGTGSAAGAGDAGLEYLPTGNDSTSPGCLCEGWGVADPATGVWGAANIDDVGLGGQNVTVESFDWTASTATSVVVVNDESGAPHFRVTHEYVPSAETPNLYQVNVTIENMSGAPIATVQYRRVMDWDVEPTAFDEFVTIDRGTASALTYTSDDGFAPSNPLNGPSKIMGEGNMVDLGPDDHGALFDFTFGPLTVGGKLSFIIFYGGAATEAEAEAALAAVGAEAYSFGQTSDDPAGGTPNTFIFAFGKVGGSAIFTPPVEPAGPVVPAAAVAPVVAAPAPAPAALAATGSDDGTVTSAAIWSTLAAALVLAGGGLLTAASVRRRGSNAAQ